MNIQNSKYILHLEEDEATSWREDYQEKLVQVTKEYEEILPYFEKQEKDYLEEKAKIDNIRNKIKRYQSHLAQLTKLAKLPDAEPRKIKKQFQPKPQRILKNIKWTPIAMQILREKQQFMKLEPLLEQICQRNPNIEFNQVNKNRLYSAVHKSSERIRAGIPGSELFFYASRIGLKEWTTKLYEDLVPDSQHTFINSH